MRKQWSRELLHTELMPICASIGRFPSRSDLEALNRGDISNTISRYGGYVEWSKRLGYERKDSDSDFGWEGERELTATLQIKGFSCAASHGLRSPYDLLVDDCLRIDVKSARKATYNGYSAWYYRIGKYVQSDIVALLRFDLGDCFFLPWYVCPATNITISENGSYREFLNNYDVLRNMIEARRHEAGKFHSMITSMHRQFVKRGSTQNVNLI